MKKKLGIYSGHVIECFDNTLYGFFAILLAPLFFPQVNKQLEMIASFGAFAAGFLARPAGAVIFGILGDKIGRKKPLIWSMSFVGFPTILIGLTPSYTVIGPTAPIILITCRLLQGFFMGGEFTGINLHISENKIHKLGTQTGFLISLGVIGAVIATSMGAVFSMQIMPVWAWRVPFIFGGLAAFVILYFRKDLNETNDFVDIQDKNLIIRNPFKEIFLHHKVKFLLSIIIAGLTIIPLYSATILGNQMFKELGYTTTESMLLNMTAMFLDAVCVLLYGRMADKLGFYRQMLLGTFLTALFTFPAFYVIANPFVTTTDIFIFICILTIIGSIINGCTMPYLAYFFPTKCRYSAVACSVTLGHALLGGTTPLVGSYLRYEFSSELAPGMWLFIISTIAFIGIYATKNLNPLNQNATKNTPPHNISSVQLNYAINGIPT